MAQAAGQVRRLAPSRELVSASPAPEEQECPAAVYRDREYQTWEHPQNLFRKPLPPAGFPCSITFVDRVHVRRRDAHARIRSLCVGHQAGNARHPGIRQDCPPALCQGEDGRRLITPECATFEEVEGQINSLQDELDEIRERARRAFQVA
jgi:hypothetical protein